MKETYAGFSREALIAMIEEALEYIQDLQGCIQSIEQELQRFHHRQPRDLLRRDEPRRPRSR